jgi:acyl-CoA reductase-like NAD-dependent aldehyde dehydrogenase
MSRSATRPTRRPRCLARDGARALRMARGIDSGVLSVNSISSVRVSTPFGGFKQSGFGRELGLHGLQVSPD